MFKREYRIVKIEEIEECYYLVQYRRFILPWKTHGVRTAYYAGYGDCVEHFEENKYRLLGGAKQAVEDLMKKENRGLKLKSEVVWTSKDKSFL